MRMSAVGRSRDLQPIFAIPLASFRLTRRDPQTTDVTVALSTCVNVNVAGETAPGLASFTSEGSRQPTSLREYPRLSQSHSSQVQHTGATHEA